MVTSEKRMVKVDKDMSREEQKRAVEMALFLGFQTVSYEFPAASCEQGIMVPKTLEELEKLWDKKEKVPIPEGYKSSTENAKPVQAFDFRKKKGLENLFEIGSFLKDNNHDLLADSLEVKIILPNPCQMSELIAACNLAFRFGMDTTAYQGGIVVEDGYQGQVLRIIPGKECSISLKEEENGADIILSGEGAELEAFTALLCNQFPELGSGQDFAGFLQELTESFAMKNPDGQLTYLECFGNPDEKSIAYMSPEFYSEQAKIHFPNTKFVNYKGMKKVYQKEYDIQWEVDDCKEKLDSVIYPLIKSGDRIRIEGALSEELPLRNELEGKIKEHLKNIGAEDAKVQILCAYKQGYSWLEETVIPKVISGIYRTGKKVKQLQIGFRPFLPKGVTDWGDIDGATPSYNNTSAAGNEHWLDLPIRFLQELYPSEDLLKQTLLLTENQIDFYTLNTDEAWTYHFRAVAEDESEIYASSFEVSTSERAYMDAFPEMGKVHPPTGYIRLYINDILSADIRIKTDTERIWEIYQGEVLKDCGQFVLNKSGGSPKVEMQPFFSQLKLDISVSEPDFKLPSREDLYSSLDALHEDLYFTGSDYFKNLGLKHGQEILDAPGLILPVIKKRSQKPRFEVTLYEQEKQDPCIELGIDGEDIEARYLRSDISVYLKELRYKENGITAQIVVDGVEEELVLAYTRLMQLGLLEQSKCLQKISELEICCDGHTNHIQLTECRQVEKNLQIEEIDIMERKVIGYEDYMHIVNQLKQVHGISVYRTAVSYAGREVYAVELLPEDAGYTSRTKRITEYPSIVINARHHANEVSGTNAALMLLKYILTEIEYKRITSRLNLVIVPMENVDGASIHYELQKDNPNWKLHVARFNAIGKEFYHEYYNMDTIHTEALGITRLWRKFLPDVMIDNHGVPSHEWEQPFSGYTAPSFKGFWLPRSLLYGYFWYVTDEAYKSNYDLNKKLEDIIAETMRSDPTVDLWNKSWMHQFKRFANEWMPKLFPANYYKDMINYWIPFEHNPEHRYPSVRFPWITSIAYTSEVADETAQGDYLYLCARAHVMHDLATLKMLSESKSIYTEEASFTNNTASVTRIRQRPVVAPADSDRSLH